MRFSIQREALLRRLQQVVGVVERRQTLPVLANLLVNVDSGGVALTGTDAGSNALFGNLQKVTAEQLGLSPILMGAANSTGGVMGKMIDAQSIVVASSATNQQGNEAAIFKAVIGHSILLASLVGLIVMFYAYVIPWAIPH